MLGEGGGGDGERGEKGGGGGGRQLGLRSGSLVPADNNTAGNEHTSSEG